MVHQLQDFEADLATLLIAADTALGGNNLSASGGDHFVAEPWTRSFPAPAVYSHDVSQAMRTNGGTKGVSSSDVSAWMREHQLDYLLHVLVQKMERADLSADRYRAIHNKAQALNTLLRTGLALGGHAPMPSFAERYRSATLISPDQPISLVDVEPIRVRLTSLLAERGYTQSHLRDALEAWTANQGILNPQGSDSAEQVKQTVYAIIDKITPLVRERLLAPLDVTLDERLPWRKLEEVPLDGFQFSTVHWPDRPHVTGSQAYQGGGMGDGSSEGFQPRLAGHFEYNEIYPATFLDLLGLTLHEVIPGHFLHSVSTDLNTRLGPEARMLAMCTPEMQLWEGVAQNAKALLFDTPAEAYRVLADVFDVDPKDLEIQDCLDNFIDAGKHNGPVLHGYLGISLEGVDTHSRQIYCLPEPLPRKISGWAGHPAIGAMYGVGYDIGRKGVVALIQKHGRIKTARVLYNTQTYVDLDVATRVLAREGK